MFVVNRLEKLVSKVRASQPVPLRLRLWSGQSFETIGEEPARNDTVIVRSKLIDPKDEPVELNYRMHKTADGWKIIDVYLDGTVSELALRRSEFSGIVKRENFDALIAALDAKIAKLAAGGAAENPRENPS